MSPRLGEPVEVKLSPPLPGFKEFVSCYLLLGEKRALLDPGPQACLASLLAALEGRGVGPETLDYLLLTHIHIDHGGALGELMGHAVKATAVVHPQGVRHLVSPERLWQGSLNTLGAVAESYGPIAPAPQARLLPAQEGMEIDLGRPLKAIYTPGHAPHHLSFWDGEEGALYIGEAAGVFHPEVDAVRPATPPPFDLETTLSSVARLASLHPRTLGYGHGGAVPAERGTLDRYRSQLRRWREIISASPTQDREAILERLLREDEELGRLQGLAGPKLEREKFFLRNSIAGFLGYLKIPP